MSNIKIVSESYNAQLQDDVIGVITEFTPIFIVIPKIASVPLGKSFVIKDLSSDAATNNIAIYTADQALIDNERFCVLNIDGAAVTIMSTGTAWSIITSSNASSTGGSTSDVVTQSANGLVAAFGTPTGSPRVYVETGAGTLSWRQLTLDDLGVAFEASLSGSQTLEIGASVVNPAFVASYSGGPATAATLTDNDGNPALTLSTPFTAATMNYTYVKTANGAAVTFTLSANKSSINDTAAATFAWYPRGYYGASSVDVDTEAEVEALASSGLQSSRARTITVTAGVGEYIWYAYPASYGAATFTIAGFEGGFDLITSTLSITNANGVTQNYRLYRSTNPSLGLTTIVVS